MSSEVATHAPLPWRFDAVRSIVKAGKYEIAALHAGVSDEETENGEFICRATNSHYELLEACRSALGRLESEAGRFRSGSALFALRVQLRNAITKATTGGHP